MIPVDIREATEADLPDLLRAYGESGIDAGEALTLDEARAQFDRIARYPSYRFFVVAVEDVAVLPEFQGNDEVHPNTAQAA